MISSAEPFYKLLKVKGLRVWFESRTLSLVGRYVPIGRVQTSIRSNAVPVSEKRGLESGVVIGIEKGSPSLTEPRNSAGSAALLFQFVKDLSLHRQKGSPSCQFGEIRDWRFRKSLSECSLNVHLSFSESCRACSSSAGGWTLDASKKLLEYLRMGGRGLLGSLLSP
ncbi:hypothetical protein VNO77_46291 [Canavalia gladiata]|uniref:Uncharacterized protein n=1 Tax=Canavalia gladiata TaxID=3824 RepID=A0AAN9PI09_CANGL